MPTEEHDNGDGSPCHLFRTENRKDDKENRPTVIKDRGLLQKQPPVVIPSPYSSSPVNPNPALTTRSGSWLNMALTDW